MVVTDLIYRRLPSHDSRLPSPREIRGAPINRSYAMAFKEFVKANLVLVVGLALHVVLMAGFLPRHLASVFGGA